MFVVFINKVVAISNVPLPIFPTNNNPVRQVEMGEGDWTKLELVQTSCF